MCYIIKFDSLGQFYIFNLWGLILKQNLSQLKNCDIFSSQYGVAATRVILIINSHLGS
jgi:hypothetical protein